MITKEKLKSEVDKLPENLLDEVYVLLKQVTKANKKHLQSSKSAAKLNDSKRLVFLKELNEAVQQVKLAKQGKVKLKSAEELLNEL